MSMLRTLVRPIATLLFAAALIGGFAVGRISADQFLPVASSVILWWFADRAAKKP